MRDRLIEILKRFTTQDCRISHECGYCDYDDIPVCSSAVADHLLANGVIVPPCKVGDTVWVYNQTAGKIFKNTIIGLYVTGKSKYKNCITCEYRNVFGETSTRKFTFAQIGRNIFLTREEAEAALAERSKE